MKKKGEILHKLKQVRYRHIKKAIRKGLARHPYNCSHNKEINLPPFSVGVCSHPSIVKGSESELPICDQRLRDLSPNCVEFCPKLCKEEIKAEVTTSLNSKELGEVAFHYPDVAALVWVLDLDLDLQGFEDLEENGDWERVSPESNKDYLIPSGPLQLVRDPTTTYFLEWCGRIKQWWKSIF